MLRSRVFDQVTLVFLAVLMFGLSATIVGILLTTPGSSKWAGWLCAIGAALAGDLFRRGVRVRTEADATGIRRVGSYRTVAYSWDEVAGFHLARPSAWSVGLWHFGDAIFVDLEDGREFPIAETMARQIYRPKKDQPDILATLRALKGASLPAP